ncbi:MAG: hypothetical protein C0500_04050 [Sphingobium sp.]|nr:hypothetical protein [Sphingobium sp.]
MIARLILFVFLLASASAARADCDAANRYVFSFANQSAATLSYGTTYSYTARNGNGATQTVTMTLTQNGLSSTAAGGVTLPAITTLVTGSNFVQTLTIGGIFGGRTSNLAGTTRLVTLTYSFPEPVRDVSFTLYDVDFASNQFRDWVQVTGSAGTVAMSAPPGNGNGASAARTATGSTVAFGTLSTPVSLTVSQAAGTAAAGNNSDEGTVNVSFAAPVTSVTLRYGNYPLVSGENSTGQQAIGISGVNYCPLPRITVTKTSTPYLTTGTNRFAIPGADVIYTFSVANTGGSPVDAATVVLTDVLPTNVTFYGGDVDDGGPATGPFEFTPGSSGLTLPTSGIAYSNNGGASYAYQATASYDANVRAIRLTPSGSFAANSSFTVRFRARIN